MSEKKKITIWSRFCPDDFCGCYKHNHIENGWADNTKPVGNEEQTRQWNNHGWMREYGYLVNGHVEEARGQLRSVKF